MLKPNLPVWRSLLYVPVNVERYVEKAHTRGADCIQLDLEDSVPASEKDAARRLVPAGGQARAARRRRRRRAHQQPDGDHGARTSTPRSGADVDGIAVTKVESADHIKRIDDHISRLESKRGLRAGHTRLIAMIESPAAFFQMPAIAAASPRLAAMNIGGEDFALETGMEPSEATLLMPKQQMIFAARAAGIMPLGFIDSLASFADLGGVRAHGAPLAPVRVHGRRLHPSRPGADRQRAVLALGGGSRVRDAHRRRKTPCTPLPAAARGRSTAR